MWNNERTLLNRKLAEADARARETAEGFSSLEEVSYTLDRLNVISVVRTTWDFCHGRGKGAQPKVLAAKMLDMLHNR